MYYPPGAAAPTSLRGSLVRGLGVAIHTVALQVRHLRHYLPQIDGYYPATINLRLEAPVCIVEPDVRTPPLVWLSSVPPEIFSLVSIRLEPLAPSPRPAVAAHIYQAHLSPHMADPWVIEVLAPRLDLAGVSECRVHLGRPASLVLFTVI